MITVNVWYFYILEIAWDRYYRKNGDIRPLNRKIPRKNKTRFFLNEWTMNIHWFLMIYSLKFQSHLVTIKWKKNGCFFPNGNVIHDNDKSEVHIHFIYLEFGSAKNLYYCLVNGVYTSALDTNNEMKTKRISFSHLVLLFLSYICIKKRV